MSELKFTPGPWRVCHENDILIIRYRKPCSPSYTPPPMLVANVGEVLCDAMERQANASLIAAAPEMYELLDRILGRLEVCKLEQSIDIETEREIRQILAKARGEVNQ